MSCETLSYPIYHQDIFQKSGGSSEVKTGTNGKLFKGIEFNKVVIKDRYSIMGKYKSQYPVVDLFAGPGGLGEGFAELRTNDSTPVFSSVASIEKEKFAYQTLLLRHFYRSFRREDVPDRYYDYLASRISKEELVSSNIENWEEAKRAVLQISLGTEKPNKVRKLIKHRLQGRKQNGFS